MMYFVFEGIDGCGKSTQIKLVSEFLENHNYEVIVTKEPGSTKLGSKLREILLDNDINICSQAEALIFTADRLQHYEEIIKPNLSSSKIILSDRSFISTLCYQLRGKYNTEIFKDIIFPDLFFIFLIDPEESLKRCFEIRNSEEISKFENYDIRYFEEVSKVYEQLPMIFPDYKKSFKYLDASKSKEEILEDIINILEKEGYIHV